MLQGGGRGAWAGFILCMGLDRSPGQFCLNPQRLPELTGSPEGCLAWDFVVVH